MLTDFEYEQLIDLLFLEERDLLEAQEALDLTDDQMSEAIERMEQEGYVKTYTVH